MRNSLMVVAVLLPATVVAQNNVPDAKPLDGQWRLLSVTENGEKSKPEDVEGSLMTFYDNGFAGFGQRTLRGTFTLDPTSDPKQIDLKLDDGRDAVIVLRGIYRRAGDQLTVCTAEDPAADRPVDFSAAAGDRQTLVVLQRTAGVVGKWERQAKTDTGELRRIVKEHRASTTTLTVYDQANQIVHQHQSSYELVETGDVHLFTYFRIQGTAGPEKGQQGAGSAYAYRVHGDLFFEFRGVVKRDESPPAIIVWQRVKAK